MTKSLNHYSQTLTQDNTQGASQAMLYGTGLKPEDMHKAQIGIASMWYEGNTCNMHLLDLAQAVKESVIDNNLLSMRFNTIGVSDGISMGTSGMRYSLQSRDLIADSIETVMAAHWYDACIALPGCDKNIPGALIALARLDRPGFLIYGGTINPGTFKEQKIDIVSAFQSYGEELTGKITPQERQCLLRQACPGAGACGGMYTANTMACALEAMGMMLPYSASTPATHPDKLSECARSGQIIKNLLSINLTPKKIITRQAIENAITFIMVLGGSTNAVLHLLAIARTLHIDLTLEDFQRISNQTPLLADLKPSGKYVMADLQQFGGTPAVLKLLLNHDLIDGSCLTITGKSLADNLAPLPELPKNNPIISTFDKPLSPHGHLQILTGNIAPEGAVAKITGKEGNTFSGSARVFDSEQAMLDALALKEINKGEVIVIRYCGPKGGPGMPEMLKPTSAIMGAGLGQDVALITDGRFSGGSHGFIVGHITPEAQIGGPLALIETGDKIKICAQTNLIEVKLSTKILATRLKQWSPPPLKAKQGTLYKYIKTVSSAKDGCVTDQPNT